MFTPPSPYVNLQQHFIQGPQQCSWNGFYSQTPLTHRRSASVGPQSTHFSSLASLGQHQSRSSSSVQAPRNSAFTLQQANNFTSFGCLGGHQCTPTLPVLGPLPPVPPLLLPAPQKSLAGSHRPSFASQHRFQSYSSRPEAAKPLMPRGHQQSELHLQFNAITPRGTISTMQQGHQQFQPQQQSQPQQQPWTPTMQQGRSSASMRNNSAPPRAQEFTALPRELPSSFAARSHQAFIASPEVRQEVCYKPRDPQANLSSKHPNQVPLCQTARLATAKQSSMAPADAVHLLPTTLLPILPPKPSVGMFSTPPQVDWQEATASSRQCTSPSTSAGLLMTGGELSCSPWSSICSGTPRQRSAVLLQRLHAHSPEELEVCCKPMRASPNQRTHGAFSEIGSRIMRPQQIQQMRQFQATALERRPVSSLTERRRLSDELDQLEVGLEVCGAGGTSGTWSEANISGSDCSRLDALTYTPVQRRRSRSSPVLSRPTVADRSTQTSRIGSPSTSVRTATHRRPVEAVLALASLGQQLQANADVLALKKDNLADAQSLARVAMRLTPCWIGQGSCDQTSLQFSPFTPSTSSTAPVAMGSNGSCDVIRTPLSSIPSPLLPSESLQDMILPDLSRSNPEFVESPTARSATLLDTLRWRAAVLSQRLIEREKQCSALREALEQTKATVPKGSNKKSFKAASTKLQEEDRENIIQLKTFKADDTSVDGSPHEMRGRLKGEQLRQPLAARENLLF